MWRCTLFDSELFPRRACILATADSRNRRLLFPRAPVVYWEDGSRLCRISLTWCAFLPSKGECYNINIVTGRPVAFAIVNKRQLKGDLYRGRKVTAPPGLPRRLFLKVSALTPLVNVDLLIRNSKGETLLTWRDDGHWAPGWHVPGGILRAKETLLARLKKTAREELGAGLKGRPGFVTFNELIHPRRAERGHFISFLYRCRLAGAPKAALAWKEGEPRPGQWAWHRRCPKNLISVHEIYRKYI